METSVDPQQDKRKYYHSSGEPDPAPLMGTVGMLLQACSK